MRAGRQGIDEGHDPAAGAPPRAAPRERRAVATEGGARASPARGTSEARATNGEADAFAAAPESRGRIAEELADVAIGVLLLADRVGLDLPAIVRAKIRRNAEKYPPERKAS